MAVSLIVIAKSPEPGRVKTRLCPPCDPEQAAAIAAASLADTLEAVLLARVARRVLVLDGADGPWLRGGIDVVAQRGRGLDERLVAAFDDVGGPALLIGMDTPQVTPALLTASAALLERPDTDALLGLARDGGWWALGLRDPQPDCLIGVPMSRADTGARQQQRLADRGMEVTVLPVLADIDTFDDAVTVASQIPTSRTAIAVAAVGAGLVAS